jgi:hypothetical protein
MTAVKYRLRFAARQATDAPSLASATIISLRMKNYENDARSRRRSRPQAGLPTRFAEIEQEQHGNAPQDKQHADANLGRQRIDVAQKRNAQRHTKHAADYKREEKGRLPRPAQDARRRKLTGERPDTMSGATTLGMSGRTLARRFDDEVGMSMRA